MEHIHRKYEVLLSSLGITLSLLGATAWIRVDIYLDQSLSLAWMCVYEQAPLNVMAFPVGEKGFDEDERQG